MIYIATLAFVVVCIVVVLCAIHAIFYREFFSGLVLSSIPLTLPVAGGLFILGCLIGDPDEKANW